MFLKIIQVIVILLSAKWSYEKFRYKRKSISFVLFSLKVKKFKQVIANYFILKYKYGIAIVEGKGKVFTIRVKAEKLMGI